MELGIIIKTTMKSDYTFQIKNSVLCIVDLDQGNASVTNNAEQVLNEIKAHLLDLQVPFPPIVIYMDTEGKWDGMEYVGETLSFYPLQQQDMEGAIDLARRRFIGMMKGATL